MSTLLPVEEPVRDVNEAGAGAAAAPGPTAPPEPYQGLAYFEERDEPRFAGRERDIEQVLARVATTRAFVLYGRSGLGKTSLLLAGVFPRLKKQNYQPVYVRTLENPLEDLVRAVQTTLQLSPAGRRETLRQVLTRATDDGTVLLVLDQFEEFFIRFKSQPRWRAEFVQALSDVILDPECDVRVIFSLREDYLAALDDFQRKLPHLFQGAYRLLPLSALGARQVIVRPLKAAGIGYDERAIARLVDELATFDFDTARLQITSTERYRTGETIRSGPRTETGPDRLPAEDRGIEGVFHRYLKAAVDQLAPDQHLLARTLLDTLITRQETKFAICQSDLNRLRFASEPEVQNVLEKFREPRWKIIRREDRAEPWYELIHECLVPEIKSWLEEDKQFRYFRLTRNQIATGSQDGKFRDIYFLLLNEEALKRMDPAHKALLRGLSEPQLEFVLMSAIYHRTDISDWAKLYGEGKSADRVRALLRDPDEKMRAGAAAAARQLPGHPDLVGECLDLALDESQPAEVQRAAGRTVAARATDGELGRVKARLRFFRNPFHLRELLADLEEVNRVRKRFSRRHVGVARRQLRRRVHQEHRSKIGEAARQGALLGGLGGLAWAVTSGGVLAALGDWLADPLASHGIVRKLWSYFGAALPLSITLGLLVGSRLLVSSRRMELITGSRTELLTGRLRSEDALRGSRILFGLLYLCAALGVGFLIFSLCLFNGARVDPWLEAISADKGTFVLLLGVTGMVMGWPCAVLIRSILIGVVRAAHRVTDGMRPSLWFAGWAALANVALCVSLPALTLLTLSRAIRRFLPPETSESGLVLLLLTGTAWTVLMGLLAFVSHFTLAVSRATSGVAQGARQPTARQRQRALFGALCLLLPVGFLALLGGDSQPLFPKRLLVEAPLTVTARLPGWPQTNYFQLQTARRSGSGPDVERNLLRVEADDNARLYIGDRNVPTELRDFVLFMPTGQSRLAISNSDAFAVKESVVRFSPVTLHTGEQIPISYEVEFIVCDLKPEPPSKPTGGKLIWVVDLDKTLVGYTRQKSDAVEVRVFENSLLRPGYVMTGYRLLPAAATNKETSPSAPSTKLRSETSGFKPLPASDGGIGIFSTAPIRLTDFDEVGRIKLPIDAGGRFHGKIYFEGEKTGGPQSLDQTTATPNVQMILAVQLRSPVQTALATLRRLEGDYQREPDNTNVARQLASAYNRSAWTSIVNREYADAWDLARKAVALRADGHDYWDTYAYAAYGTERWSEAVKGWETVIKLNGKLDTSVDEARLKEARAKAALQSSPPPAPGATPTR